MGKARVALSKIVTVPHLEIVVVIVAAAVSNFLSEKLDLKVDQEFFSIGS